MPTWWPRSARSGARSRRCRSATHPGPEAPGAGVATRGQRCHHQPHRNQRRPAVPAFDRLTDEQLKEVLELVKDADSVELKLTVPETARSKTAAALGIDPLDAQIRQVFFFDTPDLGLYDAGVVVRARRRQNEEGDTVVKLRPVVPADLPEELRRSESFNVEVDAMPGGYVCSASFKGIADNAAIREVGFGRAPIGKLFSKEQRAFYAEHAPEGIGLDDLMVLGPIPTFRLKTKPEGFGRKLVGEMWMYPDGSEIVELSTKCEPNEAFQAAAETRGYLSSIGVDLTAEQQTKTKAALAFFTDAPVEASGS